MNKKVENIQKYLEGKGINATEEEIIDAALGLLKVCWPDVWVEIQARYNAHGGRLRGD